MAFTGKSIETFQTITITHHNTNNNYDIDDDNDGNDHDDDHDHDHSVKIFLNSKTSFQFTTYFPLFLLLFISVVHLGFISKRLSTASFCCSLLSLR